MAVWLQAYPCYTIMFTVVVLTADIQGDPQIGTLKTPDLHQILLTDFETYFSVRIR